MNTLYWVMLVIGLVLLVAINLALVAMVMRFRSARGREPRRLVVRRPAQLGTAGVFAAIVVVDLRARRDRRPTTRRRWRPPAPTGCRRPSLITAQSSLSLPVTAASSAPLEIKACGQQWIWRYEYPDGTYSYYELVVPVDTRYPAPLLDRRRPSLVGPGPERQVRRDAGREQLDLVQGRRDRRLRRRQLRLLRGQLRGDADPRPRRRRADLPGLARAAGRRHPGGPDLRAAGERGELMSNGRTLAPHRPELVTDGARAFAPALARDGDEPRPQGRRPHLHRRGALASWCSASSPSCSCASSSACPRTT